MRKKDPMKPKKSDKSEVKAMSQITRGEKASSGMAYKPQTEAKQGEKLPPYPRSALVKPVRGGQF